MGRNWGRRGRSGRVVVPRVDVVRVRERGATVVLAEHGREGTPRWIVWSSRKWVRCVLIVSVI